MLILNLGCGNKTCNRKEVISIDWSVSLVLKKNFFLRTILSKFLSKERLYNINKLIDIKSLNCYKSKLSAD